MNEVPPRAGADLLMQHFKALEPSPPVLRPLLAVEHPAPLSVQFLAKPKRRACARHRALGGKDDVKVVEEMSEARMGHEAEPSNFAPNT